ncbi:MAG TPA: response regulator [Leptolyngbyaceae cyanobacterium]
MVKKVLIVEDEEALQDLIETKYEGDKRYQFYFASNGKEGLQVLSANAEWEELPDGRRLVGCKINLVVTDLRMPFAYRSNLAHRGELNPEDPAYDGVDFLRQINNLRYSVGKIVISAYGSPIVLEQIMAEGAFRFISKPFALEALEQAFNDYFRQRSHRCRKTPGGFIEQRGNSFLQRWRDDNGRTRSLSIPGFQLSQSDGDNFYSYQLKAGQD